jgi:hypothetical protein
MGGYTDLYNYVKQQVARTRFMGATGWSYFVPYEADVSVVLPRLREDVFARGDYIYGDRITDAQRKAILEQARPELTAEPLR